jgi:hypothetical protein
MWPVAEMAGRDRVKYLEDVLYVYDHAGSWEQSVSRAERQRELDIVQHVRGLPAYQRLEAL